METARHGIEASSFEELISQHCSFKNKCLHCQSGEHFVMSFPIFYVNVLFCSDDTFLIIKTETIKRLFPQLN